MMKFSKLPEFQKEFKKLQKKYSSLPNDLKEFQKIVSKIPLGNNRHFNVLTKRETTHIVKARFFCRYLKGSSLRIVYAYLEKETKIVFFEIYSKSIKEAESDERIKKYFSKKG